MSIIKLAFAITLSVVPVILSFVEPATAQRRLRANTYSQTSSNVAGVLAQFNLVDTTRDGNPIIDTESDPNLGLFKGAIQDYTTGQGQLCSSLASPVTQRNCNLADRSLYLFDESGFPIFDPAQPFVPDPQFMPVDLDLRAEFIEDDLDQIEGIRRDVIRYTFIRPEDNTRLLGFSLDFARFELDANEAINNLSYILERNVLGINIVPRSNILLQNRFERNIPNAVPEPSATLGALAAVSIGVLFKLKKKQV